MENRKLNSVAVTADRQPSALDESENYTHCSLRSAAMFLPLPKPSGAVLAALVVFVTYAHSLSRQLHSSHATREYTTTRRLSLSLPRPNHPLPCLTNSFSLSRRRIVNLILNLAFNTDRAQKEQWRGKFVPDEELQRMPGLRLD